MEGWRPSIPDVEKIAHGQPAKRKGTGSRGVPHRLNQEEWTAWNIARKQGFCTMNGSGWRSERRDAPLWNSYRSLCDARGQAMIVHHKSGDGMQDAVVVDLSPLRTPEDFSSIATHCVNECYGAHIVAPEAVVEDQEEITTTDDDSSNDIAATPWHTEPIYRLAPYYIVWDSLQRSEAKSLGKKLGGLFDTSEGKNKAATRKSIGIKPGKGRRHGGYGIG